MLAGGVGIITGLMAKAAQPVPMTAEITFELERFELVNGRLKLIGRWFGVRGRRFVRPTLTPLGGRDLTRVLADLEHKPWAAEDGEAWEAAFPWDQNGATAKFELSVAPDITIQLPSPGAKLGRSRRLTALPRRPVIAPPLRRPQAAEVAASPPELESVRDELEAVRRELDVVRGELEATKSDLAAARAGSARTGEEIGELTGQRDQLATELALAQQAIAELRSALDQTRSDLAEASRQRDDAITAHGAALVMRRATRALPHDERKAGWWVPAAVILALVGIVLAILIVVHVL